MMVSSKTLKWAMRMYPPLLFQRIWVQYFAPDFKSVAVKINKSILNQNYNKSIFGGTIFAAADPFYAVLFDQIFQRKGYKVRVWLKSATINYLKPGRTDLYFQLEITEEMIVDAEQALKTVGKFVKSYPIYFKNKEGEICAQATNEVYIRNLFPNEAPKIAY